MTPRQATFNGYQFQNMSANVGTMLTLPDHDGNTDNIITSEYHLTRGTGSVVTNQDVDAKKIIITGSIIGSSVDDMESRIDSMEQQIQGVSALLAIQYDFGTRNYNATYKSLVWKRGGANVTKADFTLTLTANSGLGYDNFTGNLNTQTYSGSPQIFTMTLSGSSPRQWLVLSGTLNTFSGSYFGMTFTNVQTGYAFSIAPRYWNVNDQFYVDMYNQQCLVNGIAVPFYGTFFSFSPTTTNNPTTSVQYSDGAIARNVTLSLSYIRRWL